MQGISTKVTGATLTFWSLIVADWLLFTQFTLTRPPDRVWDAITGIAIFAGGYLVAEYAPNIKDYVDDVEDEEQEVSPLRGYTLTSPDA